MKRAFRVTSERPSPILAEPDGKTALSEALLSLAGDPSEVTALGMRHWTTSFRC